MKIVLYYSQYLPPQWIHCFSVIQWPDQVIKKGESGNQLITYKPHVWWNQPPTPTWTICFLIPSPHGSLKLTPSWATPGPHHPPAWRKTSCRPSKRSNFRTRRNWSSDSAGIGSAVRSWPRKEDCEAKFDGGVFLEGAGNLDFFMRAGLSFGRTCCQLVAFFAEIEIRWLRQTGPLAFCYGGCCQSSWLRLSTTVPSGCVSSWPDALMKNGGVVSGPFIWPSP